MNWVVAFACRVTYVLFCALHGCVARLGSRVWTDNLLYRAVHGGVRRFAARVDISLAV